MFRQFFHDNHGFPQMAHLLAFGAGFVSTAIMGIGLYLVWIKHPDGVQVLFIGAGIMTGAGTLEGVERKIEGPSEGPGK